MSPSFIVSQSSVIDITFSNIRYSLKQKKKKKDNHTTPKNQTKQNKNADPLLAALSLSPSSSSRSPVQRDRCRQCAERCGVSDNTRGGPQARPQPVLGGGQGRHAGHGVCVCVCGETHPSPCWGVGRADTLDTVCVCVCVVRLTPARAGGWAGRTPWTRCGDRR